MTQASKSKSSNSEIMIINDDPGITTRIAISENGRLEELYTERAKTATSVGNIYKGIVTNVESAIQAAFIEYGEPQRGFLHITDLHPKYFPGKEKSERVGKKVARHARPLIQKCLKKGDEILVQVMKEGLGTKGPTLTSYLSIPGRLSVMMPYMNKVGVSRKIEDLDDRREMREILEAINLPKGFGFILRTAGKGKKLAEVKRDIAYLIRLWKMIEKRIDTIAAPCPLYNESDLVVRTIRDVLRPSIEAIIVDSEAAYDRIQSFLKVATPRSSRKIIRYYDSLPIFHAFDIERQIEEIHNREVHLPSGGRLVIDQTEALVAIDVNSGKSRGAKNSESNAYNTNMEAADEICRQLRLRDLGGLVINDLIDMTRSSNRKKVEERFEMNLARDRARASVLPISRFGLMEMTRQRMRPSVLESHYGTCRHCEGRGLVKTPEEVASDATRHAGWMIRNKNVQRVEIACSAIVGTSLLSNKRAELNKHEQDTGKRMVVRISETIASDQIAYFAYDKHGADIDISALPSPTPPTFEQLAASEAGETKTGKEKRTSKRGRRSRKEIPLAEAQSISEDSDLDAEVAFLSKTVPGKRMQKSRSHKKVKSPAESAMRVYELARSIGRTSKEVIERCKEADISVSNHMSKLTTDIASSIESLFDSDAGPETKTPAKKRRRRGRRRRDRRTHGQQSKRAEEKKGATQEEVKDKRPKNKAPSERRTKKVLSGSGSKNETKTAGGTRSRKARRKPKTKRANRRSSGRSIHVKKSEVDAKKGAKEVARKTLYGSSRRTISADETSTIRGDRE